MSLIEQGAGYKKLITQSDKAIIYPNKIISVVLILLLIMTSSNAFLQYYRDGLIAFTTFFVVALLVHYHRGVRPLFLLYLLFFAFWILYIAWFWKFANFNTIIGFYCRIIISFGTIVLLGKYFFPTLVNVVYGLSAVSLCFFITGLTAPFLLDTLQGFLQLFPTLFVIDHDVNIGWGRLNCLIYTFSMNRLNQNHGFMWEPTAFAAVLLLTMMIHLSLSKMTFDRKFWLLVLAFISTLSTTGFVAGLFVVCFILLNKNAKTKMGIFLLMVPLIVFLVNLDFISGKINHELSRGDSMAGAHAGADNLGNSRLSSFLWDMKDFSTAPYFGIGIFEEVRYNGFQKAISVNGVSDTLVRFGLIGSILFLLVYTLSFFRFLKEQGYQGTWLFILLLLTLSWSERLTLLPLFMVFQFYIFTPYLEDSNESESTT